MIIFLINVSNELKNTDYHKDVKNKILLNVLDNCEFTPHSSESTPVTFATSSHSHLIKINSQLAYKGITEFISKDVMATDTFINSMTDSNIYELYKAINWFTQTLVLEEWLLHNIKSQIKNKYPLLLHQKRLLIWRLLDLQIWLIPNYKTSLN